MIENVPMKDEHHDDVIFLKNVTIDGDLLVKGICVTVNSTTRTITPILYNPIEKDVELSKFILEQFKTYDSQIESLQENVKRLEIIISELKDLYRYDDSE
jgi:hypothetical protein